MKQKLLCFFMLGILLVGSAYAQSRRVSGRVTSDVDGAPVPGVSVSAVGANVATQTDELGTYTIDIGVDVKSLDFRFLGYVSQRIAVTGTTLNVVLAADETALEEVIVIGYGTQIRRTSTDNIARVGSADISEIPSPAFQNTLAGKAPGVQIVQTNGKVEGGISMRIRGVGSVSAGAEPLYVLDGMPLITRNESNNTAPQNPLLTISPNEIESIDILKDASAVAIYGSRGANGVVIITTKTGKSGAGSISANISHGISGTTNRREWLNASQYIELLTEAAINSYGEADGIEAAEGTFDWLAQGKDWRNGEVDTDWQDLVFVKGHVSDADLSFSGGNEKTTYFFSGAYNNTKGIVIGNEMDRITSRINVSHKFSDKFTAGANLGFSRTGIDRIANDNAFVTPLQAVAQSPLSPAYFDDGEPNNDALYANFLLEDKYGFYKTNIRRVTGRAFGEYQIIPSLKFNTDFGYDLYYQTEDSFRGRKTPFQSTNGEAYAYTVGTESYISSNYFTFNKTFAEAHDLTVVAGMEYNDTRRRYQSVSGIQFPSDDFQTVNGAAEITGGTGTFTEFNFLSYFARANYTFKDRYLFKASIRRDGSSRFANDFRYGTFGSLAAGWIISEEEFLQDAGPLSFLKLRGSWGQTGNAQITDFLYMGLYGAVAYKKQPGIFPTQPANPFLTWEGMNQYDIGVDYGFLNNRISGEIDYYVKRSDGLLFDLPLPGTSGFDVITRNIGAMENQGFEFLVRGDIIKKEGLQWNASVNFATNKNRVLTLPNGADAVTERNVLREGETINSFYLVEYAGVDPENGDALFYKNTENADGTINRDKTNDYSEARRVIAGRPIPTLIGGLSSSLTYKDFDFSFTFQGDWGASIYNQAGLYQSANMIYEDNQTRDQLRRWTPENRNTDVPQARLYQTNGSQNSTRYLEEASFVRLRNVNFGYTLPSSLTRQAGINRVRLYVTAFNLLTFTNYSGYDPESRSDAAASQLIRGIDFYSAPQARTYSFGINVNF